MSDSQTELDHAVVLLSVLCRLSRSVSKSRDCPCSRHFLYEELSAGCSNGTVCLIGFNVRFVELLVILKQLM